MEIIFNIADYLPSTITTRVAIEKERSTAKFLLKNDNELRF